MTDYLPSCELADISNAGRKASKTLTADIKYENTAEFIEKEGVYGAIIYDQRTNSAQRIQAYKATMEIAKNKLQEEQNSTKGIKDVMVQFESQLKNSDSEIAGTKVEKANSILRKIENILRKKNASGEYVFGGNNSYVDPLSIVDENGNRVRVDLTKSSNLVNGQIINNYTSTGANQSLVSVSDSHEAQSFSDPNMLAIGLTIGYLNAYKADPPYPPRQIDELQRKASVEIQGVISRMQSELNKLETSEEENSNARQKDKEYFDSLRMNTAQAVDEINRSDRMTRSTVSQKVAENNLTKDLADKLMP